MFTVADIYFDHCAGVEDFWRSKGESTTLENGSQPFPSGSCSDSARYEMELAKIEITQNNEHGCHTEFVGGGLPDESHI